MTAPRPTSASAVGHVRCRQHTDLWDEIGTSVIHVLDGLGLPHIRVGINLKAEAGVDGPDLNGVRPGQAGIGDTKYLFSVLQQDVQV